MLALRLSEVPFGPSSGRIQCLQNTWISIHGLTVGASPGVGGGGMQPQGSPVEWTVFLFGPEEGAPHLMIVPISGSSISRCGPLGGLLGPP